jgi:hypothetical protein
LQGLRNGVIDLHSTTKLPVKAFPNGQWLGQWTICGIELEFDIRIFQIHYTPIWNLDGRSTGRKICTCTRRPAGIVVKKNVLTGPFLCPEGFR